MKRKVILAVMLALSLVIACSFCLTGCGSNADEGNGDAVQQRQSEPEQAEKAQQQKSAASEKNDDSHNRNKITSRLSQVTWNGVHGSEYKLVRFSGNSYTLILDTGAVQTGTFTLTSDCSKIEMYVNGGDPLTFAFRMTKQKIYFDNNEFKAAKKMTDNWND
ncbi:MAG: hypothetical protein ACOX4I_00115 [Anaerovoracaceae bacterium]